MRRGRRQREGPSEALQEAWKLEVETLVKRLGFEFVFRTVARLWLKAEGGEARTVGPRRRAMVACRCGGHRECVVCGGDGLLPPVERWADDLAAAVANHAPHDAELAAILARRPRSGR
jgi:hypothetical protein